MKSPFEVYLNFNMVILFSPQDLVKFLLSFVPTQTSDLLLDLGGEEKVCKKCAKNLDIKNFQEPTVEPSTHKVSHLIFYGEHTNGGQHVAGIN